MRKVNIAIVLVAVGVVVFGLPQAALCDEPIVKVNNLGQALVFEPLVEYKELILTVTGPCDYQYRQVLDKNKDQLIFKLDETTIDGAYTFSVVLMPFIDPEIIEMLEKARGMFDEETPRMLCRQGKLPGPPTMQSGGLIVSRGEIIFDEESVEKSSRVKQLHDLGSEAQMTPINSSDITVGGSESAFKVQDQHLKDYVIYDDLIVDGSACIGFDCVNGETFDFDTIRLKENNLRIKFDDTSTIASYPRNDWQLTANASANGGANKFSIDDITGGRTPFTVEANARSHSLYVDDYGRIGSRTSTPYTEIHTIDGDTPTLRLQQDGSSGFSPQVWDVAGNESNFFVRDVTNGSKLPFRIQPGTPTSTLSLRSTGWVGIGTWTPAAPLHVIEGDDAGPGNSVLILQRPGDLAFQLKNTTNSDFWQVSNSGANDRLNFSRSGTGGVEMMIDAGGTLTVRSAIVVGSTTLNVPDYVFAEDYELMPVSELDEFVQTEGHLPGIPSAQEINTSGLNMTEMQIHLLRKVEELTLYVIEQKKEIEEQQKQIQAMQAQLKSPTNE